jgi:hypothetical protein
MILSHFKKGGLESINFNLIQHNDLDLQGIIIRKSMTTESTTCHYAYF